MNLKQCFDLISDLSEYRLHDELQKGIKDVEKRIENLDATIAKVYDTIKKTPMG